MPQEIKKRRIVIASVLKPVNDPRGFEKMAHSLARENFDVFLIGQPSQIVSADNPSIQLLALPKFDRSSFFRWLAPVVIARKIHQVKPEILIVNTHELLIVAVINRILFGTRILYDVQENYALNLLQTNVFPATLRTVLAAWVRLKEKVTSPLFHHFLLAEKSYENELPFIAKKYSIVENKVTLPVGFARWPPTDKMKLIFTGTLAENTGVFRAIELAERLHALEPKIELLLIGFCAQQTTLNRIERAIQNRPFVTLKGGGYLVPHTEILHAIATASFGIISYPILPYLKNKMPTKLYEYLAYQLPILLQYNTAWTALTNQLHGGISLDFDQYDPVQLLSQMRSRSFYQHASPRTQHSLLWSSDEPTFIRAVVEPTM